MTANSTSNTFIPFREWEGIGGPYTFMDNLRREFEQRSISLCPTFQDCHQMLFPIRYDMDKLHWGRCRGKKYIVRLDGIWYPEKHGENYRRLNQTVKEIYQHYADYVIFQSEYCRQQCFEMFGSKPESDYRIVINGADQRLFFPNDQKSDLSETVQFVTTGNFRNRDMIEPLILALDQVQLDRKFQLRIVGPVADELQQWLERDFVVQEGTKTVAETAAILRNADIFLYSHLNPPCPNSVIEAVSTALPVVGFASGAMAELLPWSTELLAHVSEATFQRYEHFDAAKLCVIIQNAVTNFPQHKSAATKHAKDYPFTACADAYLDVLKSVATRSAPTPPSNIAGWIHSRTGRFIGKLIKRLKLDTTLRSVASELLASCPENEFLDFEVRTLQQRTERLPPSAALKTMFELDKRVYELEGKQAIAYDDGIHTKHRHMQYHAFFVKNVQDTDRILDLGCGKGELANSVAKAVLGGRVYGIDRKESSIIWARKEWGEQKNLEFVLGDITESLPGEKFDVIIMSNVLEHIEHRVDLLRQLISLFEPRQMLIRVPVYQRDWRVPLKDEMGFDYRLDLEHFIEFTPENFADEMDQAGMSVGHIEYRWGEIWACVVPK